MVKLTRDETFFEPNSIEHYYKLETDLKGEELIKAVQDLIKVPHSREFWFDKQNGVLGTEYFYIFTSEDGMYVNRIVFRRRRI